MVYILKGMDVHANTAIMYASDHFNEEKIAKLINRHKSEFLYGMFLTVWNEEEMIEGYAFELGMPDSNVIAKVNEIHKKLVLKESRQWERYM